jgi:hypothetical protein
MKTFKFRIFTGPVAVKQYAARMRRAGIHAKDGTEHVYGQIQAEDRYAAYNKLSKATGMSIRPNEVWDDNVIRSRKFGSARRGSTFVAIEFDLAKGARTGRRMVFVAKDIREAASHLVYTLNLKSSGWRASPSGKTVGRMSGDIGWHIIKEGTVSARAAGNRTRGR